MQALLACRAFQFQHQIAAKGDVSFGDGDGVPSVAATLLLGDAGLGILESKLCEVFLLLQLHKGLHVTQLYSGEGRGGIEIKMVQRDTDRTVA